MFLKNHIFIYLLIIIFHIEYLSANDQNKQQICRKQSEENLIDFVKNQWKIPIENIDKIKEVSQLFSIPDELMLAAFLIEDIRFYRPLFNENMLNHTYIKGQMRLLIPNTILDFWGHAPNRKHSNLGLVNMKSIKKSIIYLLKQSIHTDLYFDILQKAYQSKITITPELAIAIHLKAIEVYWQKYQISLINYPFQDSSWGFRLGIWISLYSILSYDGQKTNDFINKSGEVKRPHPHPQLGGTILWNCISYGEIVKIFIDLNLYHQNQIMLYQIQ